MIIAGKTDNSMQNKLDSALADVNDKYLLLEETEKNAVRQALIEERSRFCLFISCLKPVVVSKMSSNCLWKGMINSSVFNVTCEKNSNGGKLLLQLCKHLTGIQCKVYNSNFDEMEVKIIVCF